MSMQQRHLRSRSFALVCKRGVVLALGLTLMLGAAFAPRGEAQLLSAPLDLQAFRPAMDSKGYITLNSSQVLGQLDFSFGLVTTWGSKVLELTNPAITANGQSSRFSIKNVITPSLQGAVGLTKFAHFGAELGIIVPVSILSGRAYPTETNGTPNTTADDNDYSIAKQGLGDIIVLPKIRLLNAARKNMGLAVIPAVVLPTGDKKAFLGEGKVIFQPSVVVDGEFGYLGRFRVAVNAGMRLRGSESEFLDDGTVHTTPRTFGGVNGVPTNTLYGVRVKNEVLGGVGLSYGVVPQKFDLVAEVYGQKGLSAKRIENTTEATLPPVVEAIGGIKLYLARNSFFLAGGGWRLASNTAGAAAPRAFLGFIFEPNVGDRDGDGYKDDVDGCPDDPEDIDEFEDADGCPDPDNDKDGILDINDLCPNDPEDKDGFEDADGCPDPDNDHDRILDVNDKCPNEPETYNGFEDEDGCPDKGRVIVRKGKLDILDKIYFETDKDEIKPVSFPLLDAIAATIKGNPQIQLIEIQGHADERGNDAHNLDLTERRAASVKRAMYDRGVEPGRLRSHGYGETKPVCTQHNEECWSRNRRSEFIILKRADEADLQGGEGQ